MGSTIKMRLNTLDSMHRYIVGDFIELIDNKERMCKIVEILEETNEYVDLIVELQ